jgi:hypothetical protein
MAVDSDQRIEDLLSAHPEWTESVVISGNVPVPVG